MCGRFTQRLSSAELARLFDARDDAELAGARYNVGPMQQVAAVVKREGEGRAVDRFRWGLVPPWAADPRVGSRMINARAETVATSPAFRHAFRAKRCLIPADGFYEWQRAETGRQPFYISSPNGTPLVFAGLRSAWHEPGGEAVLRTCAIVTTTPNDLMARLHNRMPVILAPDAWELWLDPGTDPAELGALLRPWAADLHAHPVAPLVNSVRNHGPELIVPLAGGDVLT